VTSPVRSNAEMGRLGIQPELWCDRQAVAAGATEASSVADEHGWRLGRIVDPFGHEWEIGTPLGAWPPSPDRLG